MNKVYSLLSTVVPSPTSQGVVVITKHTYYRLLFLPLCRLKDYTLAEPDPLVEGVPKRDNPFIKKSNCIIL